jgi:hypothetical protein
MLPAAARRRGAAWRRPRRLRRRSSVAATTRRLGRAARASPATLAATRGSRARLACFPCVCKKVRGSLRVFSRCVYVCVCPVRISDAPNSPLCEGVRGVVWRRSLPKLADWVSTSTPYRRSPYGYATNMKE